MILDEKKFWLDLLTFDCKLLMDLWCCLPGIIYDVIVEPPSVGSTTDEFGHSKPVSICPEHWSQTEDMCERINFRLLRTNFLHKISHSWQISNEKWIVHKNMLKERKLGKRNTFGHKAYPNMGILLIYHSILSFSQKGIHFWSTLTNWLVQLFVTFVKLLCSDTLKACHLVIATFTHAKVLDHCGHFLKPAKHFPASQKPNDL